MSTLVFPKHFIQTHHDMVGRAAFVAHYARLAGIDVKMVENTDTVWMQRKVPGKGWIPEKGNHLSCVYNGKQIIFECSDFAAVGREQLENFPNIPYFKYHYDRELYADNPKVFPVGPCMILPSNFSVFQQYFKMRKAFRFTCSNNIISNRQEPRRLALERRTKVQRVLRQKYKTNLDINWKGTQQQFWNANKDCLASICIPGACNNMLDRGHYELLGLGVCTISPHIPTILPWNTMLIPNEHYIMCKDDYSDLVEKIEWCRENRAECVDIGDCAKDLFNMCCTPDKYWEWIDVCLENNE